MASIDNKQDIAIAWIVSLSIHVLFFSLGGKIFIKPPQFAIAPSKAVEDVSPADRELQIIDIKLIDSPNGAIQVQQKNKPLIKDIEKTIPKIPRPIMTSHAEMKVEAKPDYIQNPPPPYPELAKQMRQEGIVMLSVDVDIKGDPVNIEIIQSSGYRLLDQAALNAVRHWKFQPGRIGDLPMESRATVPVRFRLEQ